MIQVNLILMDYQHAAQLCSMFGDVPTPLTAVTTLDESGTVEFLYDLHCILIKLITVLTIKTLTPLLN